MWRAFFPRGLIVGVDIHDKKPHDEARIKTFKGSQSDQVFLERVVSEIGRPDIIIDDGSHEYKDIVASYNFLFPKLKPGGYYAIEDTFFAYAPDFCGSDPDPDSPLATVGYFKQLVHRLNHRERVDSRQTSNYGELIVAVCFYNNLVVIKKGDDEATPDVDAFFYEDGARTFESQRNHGTCIAIAQHLTRSISHLHRGIDLQHDARLLRRDPAERHRNVAGPTQTQFWLAVSPRRCLRARRVGPGLILHHHPAPRERRQMIGKTVGHYYIVAESRLDWPFVAVAKPDLSASPFN